MTEDVNPFTDFETYEEYQALKPEREAHKRFVQKALREAGRRHLAAIGFRPAGSSGRRWTYDGGWWLCNVFFGAGRSVSAELQIGCQYLWKPESSPIEGNNFFEWGRRRDLRTRVQLEVDQQAVLEKTDLIAQSAHQMVTEIFRDTEDGHKHLALLAAGKRPGPKFWAGELVEGERWPIDAYSRAIALGVTGEIDAALEVVTVASSVVRERGEVPPPPTAAELEPLRLAMTNVDEFRQYVDSTVRDTRQALKFLRPLPDTDRPPWH